MIVLYYHDNKVVNVSEGDNNEIIKTKENNAFNAIKELSKKYPDRWIVWCDHMYKEQLDVNLMKTHLVHKLLMISHNVGKNQFLGADLGYVEESPFINVTSGVAYPTWQMSSIGAVQSEVIVRLAHLEIDSSNFLYAINSLAKQGQQLGLICKQVPLTDDKISYPKASRRMLFSFVGQHYRKRWMFILWFCLFLFKKDYATLALLSNILIAKTKPNGTIPRLNSEDVPITSTVDVLIPTVGRKQFLYDVLNDLTSQTLIPQNVIIIEQNPELNSNSNLNYLTEETWPFKIDHIFTHQTGACNARNIGLENIKSEWVFMADDDIRFGDTVLEESIAFAKTYHTQAITLSCLQEGDREKEAVPIQWNGFGSGCSVVRADAIGSLKFDPALEHGFGEDADFGNQLRKKGVDIIYNPFIKLHHLKAPVGGFRAPWIAPWVEERPKPSPTVMVSILKHWSLEQRQSYKLVLWSKFYKLQAIKNPLSYVKMMRSRWNSSLKWAHKLQEENV